MMCMMHVRVRARAYIMCTEAGAGRGGEGRFTVNFPSCSNTLLSTAWQMLPAVSAHAVAIHGLSLSFRSMRHVPLITLF